MEPVSLENLEFPKVLAMLASHAGSQAAKEAVVALRPATEAEAVESALTDLDEVVRLFDRGIGIPIGGVRELRDVLERLAVLGELLDGEELLRIRADLEVMRQLQKTMAEVDDAPRLRARLDAVPDLAPLHREIVATLRENGELRDDASPRLTTIRRELARTRQDLERRLGEMLGGSADLFSDRFFTQRNDRYVLPVKAEVQSQLPGIVHDQSGSGRTVFLEPLELLGANNRLISLRVQEREEIIAIFRQLTDQARRVRTELVGLFGALVAIDVLVAKCRFARAMGAHRPVIDPHGVLSFRQLRHPMLHPNCVAIDPTLEPGAGVVIITGPNAGGKTVTLKMVGINVLLAQSGCYVLAAPDARVPVFTRVLADIGESQSIEAHLSTFTSHLARLVQILGQADERSLVLLDELGVGTDPTEGAALATGVLKFLRTRRALVLATSHFEALKRLGFTEPGIRNGSMEFDETTKRPTYRFMLGVSGRSNAMAIAREFALPAEVLAEMTAIIEGLGGSEVDLLAELERERLAVERLRRELDARHRALLAEEQELAGERRRLAEFRRRRRDELVEKIETELGGKVREFETLIRDLRAAAPTAAATAVGLAREGLSDLRQTVASLDAATRALDEGASPGSANPGVAVGGGDDPTGASRALVIGGRVRWTRMSLPADLVAIDTARGRAVIDCDGRQITVAVTDLQPLPPSRRAESGSGWAEGGGGGVDPSAVGAGEIPARDRGPGSTPGSAASRVVAPRPHFRDELDLRGMRVEEAIAAAEVWLPQAESAGFGKVRLVHGKGTGALMRAIGDWLRTTRWRDRFRLGRYGEGDHGVTVVVFDPAADEESPATRRMASPPPDAPGVSGKRPRGRHRPRGQGD